MEKLRIMIDQEVEISVSTLSSADLVDRAGVSDTQLRDWRRRGILAPVGTNQARHDPQLVATIIVMKKLMELGIGPTPAHGPAVKIASHAFCNALLNGGLYTRSLDRSSEDRADQLDYAIAREMSGVAGMPQNWAVVLPGGEFAITDDVEAEVRGNGGGALIVCIESVANELLRAFSGPIVSVTVR